MSSFDELCPSWAPDERACAGNGICTSMGLCSCNNDWTGIGDFIPIDIIHRDCAISRLAVILLWSLTAVSLLSLLVSATIRIIKAIRLYHASHIAIAGGQPYGHEASTRRPVPPSSQFRTAPSNGPINAFTAAAVNHTKDGGISPGGTPNNGNIPLSPNGHTGVPMMITGDGTISVSALRQYNNHHNHTATTTTASSGVQHVGGGVYHGHGHLPHAPSSAARNLRQYTSHGLGDAPLGSPNHPAQSMAFNHERTQPGCCHTSMIMLSTLLRQLPFLMAVNCVAFGIICSIFIALKLSGQMIGHDVPVTVFFFLTGATYWTLYHWFSWCWVSLCGTMSRLSGAAGELAAANVARTRRLLQGSWIVSMIAYTPVAILAAHPEWQLAMQLLLLNGRIVAMWCCALIMRKYGKQLEILLSTGLDGLSGARRANRLAVMTRVQMLSKQAIKQSIFETTLGQLLTWWPWFRMKMSYTLPITWTVAIAGGAVYLYALTSESEAAERRIAADPDSRYSGGGGGRPSQNGRRSKVLPVGRSSQFQANGNGNGNIGVNGMGTGTGTTGMGLTSITGSDMPPLPPPSQPGTLVAVTSAGTSGTVALTIAVNGTRSWRAPSSTNVIANMTPAASPKNNIIMINNTTTNNSHNGNGNASLAGLNATAIAIANGHGNSNGISSWTHNMTINGDITMMNASSSITSTSSQRRSGWRASSPLSPKAMVNYDQVPSEPAALTIRTSTEAQPKSGRLGPPPHVSNGNGAAGTASSSSKRFTPPTPTTTTSTTSILSTNGAHSTTNGNGNNGGSGTNTGGNVTPATSRSIAFNNTHHNTNGNGNGNTSMMDGVSNNSLSGTGPMLSSSSAGMAMTAATPTIGGGGGGNDDIAVMEMDQSST